MKRNLQTTTKARCYKHHYVGLKPGHFSQTCLIFSMRKTILLASGLTLGSVARHVRKVVQVELSTLLGPGPFRSPKRQKLKSWKPQLRHLSDKAIFHRDPSSLSDLEGNDCIFVWLFHLIDCDAFSWSVSISIFWLHPFDHLVRPIAVIASLNTISVIQ